MAGLEATGTLAPFTINREDYAVTHEVIERLAIPGVALPAYEALEEAVATAGVHASYWGVEAKLGQPPELTVNLPVTGQNSLVMIFRRFGAEFGGSPYLQPTWMGTGAHSHDTQSGRVGASFALRDHVDPRDRHVMANAFDEAGLVYTDSGFRQQVRAVSHEARSAQRSGMSIRTMTHAEYLVLQAKRRVAGDPALDTQTTTSFLSPRRGNAVLAAHQTESGVLQFGTVNKWAQLSTVGVRRVAELRLPARG